MAGIRRLQMDSPEKSGQRERERERRVERKMDSDFGVPGELSDLQKQRAEYQPGLPPCLQVLPMLLLSASVSPFLCLLSEAFKPIGFASALEELAVYFAEHFSFYPSGGSDDGSVSDRTFVGWLCYGCLSLVS